MSITETVTSPKKESLFSLGEHFYALESLLIETEGEITDELDTWLQEYEGKEEEKIDAYCYVIQKFENISEESRRLAERSSSYSGKAKNLKDRLKFYLVHRGKERVETDRFTVSVCNNGGMLPVRLHDHIKTDDLPDQFVRVYREPDMNQIRESLLNNDEEVTSFAYVLPRGTHLRIK